MLICTTPFLTYFSLSKTTIELLIWRIVLQYLPPKDGSMEVTFQTDCVLIYNEQTLLSQELLTSFYWNSGPFTSIMNILTKKFLLLLWESENFTVISKAKCGFLFCLFMILIKHLFKFFSLYLCGRQKKWPPKDAYVIVFRCVNMLHYMTNYKNKLC